MDISLITDLISIGQDIILNFLGKTDFGFQKFDKYKIINAYNLISFDMSTARAMNGARSRDKGSFCRAPDTPRPKPPTVKRKP